MARWYTDPIVDALRALGVLFASPPQGSTNMAGIVYDENTNEPTEIQTPAGTRVPFPGGAGAIPIPTSNNNNDLVLQSEPGGLVQVNAGATTVGQGPAIELNGGFSESSGAQGGGVFINGAQGGPNGEGGEIGIVGGGANEGTGALGAVLNLRGGQHASGFGGSLELLVGDDAASAANNGKLYLGTATGSVDFGVAPGTQVVTIGALGPGASPLGISAWIPATLDGVDGYIPFFTA